MKNKLNFKFLSLFALLFMAFSNSLWSAEVDTVWYVDFNGGIRLQHPVTKNIILEGVNKLIEIDYKNGQIIKEMPFTNDPIEKPYISPDGTKLLHTVDNDTYIYEYPGMELIIKIDSIIISKIINDDEIIGRYLSNKFIKYNIKTKEKQIYIPKGGIADIATSPDGRFIAYSSIYTDVIGKIWARLYLLDAKTMTEIALLEEVEVEAKSLYYARMNFSYDGKYLATNATTYGSDLQRNIYSTETLKSIKNYNPSNFKTDFSYVKFLNEILYTSEKYNIVTKENFTIIKDINTDKTLLEIGNSNGIYFLFNNDLNYLYYYDDENKKNVCINISNIITGVSSPQPITIVKYQNKELIINKENVRKIEVTDISGRVIINKIIENPFSNNTILPLNLANGAYLINITTEKESFTHKLMVLE